MSAANRRSPTPTALSTPATSSSGVATAIYFAGRKGGIINIGGLKVHPEEIEAVINRHPQVRMSLVRPKRNPITGAIVVADVVLKVGRRSATSARQIELKDDILKFCRAGAAASQGSRRDQLRARAQGRRHRQAGCAARVEHG